MTTHYAHNPDRGLSACNLLIAPPLTPRLETTTDWDEVECEKCRQVGNQWSRSLNLDPEPRALVHHSASITSGTDCGAQADGIKSILSNLTWDKVTCWDCLSKRAWVSDVGQVVPVQHDSVFAPKAAHTHDCKACVYLTSVVKDDRENDIYFCPGRDKPTIVVRFSSEGPDYYSGLALSDKDELVALGFVNALKRGLIAYADAVKTLNW